VAHLTSSYLNPNSIHIITYQLAQYRVLPDTDVASLTTTVFAKIAGIPFPFIGVDGTNACPYIFFPDDSKAGCPLKAGQDYVYQYKLKVLEIYPKVSIYVLQFREDY
jgi:Niemann-Pick C2 protein